jgi:hypothetical protein
MSRPARVLRVAAYVAGVLLFFEAGARLALSSDVFFRRIQGPSAAWWRLRFTRGHASGAGLYYRFDVHHPTRGWALRPRLRDAVAFGDRLLSSNSEGVRARREYARPKPAGLRRVIVLGDSFTFGDEVSDDETYSHFLQELLPGVEVVNLGVHGYGHDQMLLYLEEVGARYQPDVVLLGFVGDDMERNLLPFRDFAKPWFEEGASGLVLRGTPVPAPEEVLAREWRRSRLLDLLSMLDDRRAWRSGASQARMQRLTFALLDRMARVIEGLGARAAYAYLPVYGEVVKADMAMTRREMAFFAYCRERGIQSMYLRRFFLRRLRAGQPLKSQGHWSAVEHRIAAEGIAAYLTEKGLIGAEPPAG